MPQTFSEKNAILDDGVWLPKFLFYFDNSKSTRISPAASFNPDPSLGKEGFESSTSPSKSPQKKTIIIDQKSLKTYKDYGEKIALLKRLQVAGFDIFLCSRTSATNKSAFHKLDKNLDNIDLLHSLSNFDETADYNDLATQGVARDKALLLGDQENQTHIKDINQAFSQHNYAGPFSGDDLRCEFLTFSEKEVEELITPSYFLEGVAFYLSRVSEPSDKLRELLKSKVWRGFDQMLLRSVDPKFTLSPEVENELLLINPTLVSGLTNVKKLLAYCESNPLLSTSKIVDLIDLMPQHKSDFLRLLLLEKFKDDPLAKILTDLYEGRTEEFLKAAESCCNGEREVLAIIKAADSEDLISRDFLQNILDNYEKNGPEFRSRLSAEELLKAAPKMASHIIKIFDNPRFNYAIKGWEGNGPSPQCTSEIIRNSPEAAEDVFKFDHLESEDFIIKQSLRSHPRVRNAILQNPSIREKRSRFGTFRITQEEANSIDHSRKLSDTKPTYFDLSNHDFTSEVRSVLFSSSIEPKALEAQGLDDKTSETVINGLNGIRDSFAHQNFDNIKRQISDHFSNVAVMRLPAHLKEPDECEIFVDLFKGQPSLKHVIIPATLRGKESEVKKICGDKISFEFFDYENYLGIGDLLKREKEKEVALKERQMRLASPANPTTSSTNQPSTTAPTKNQIRIAQVSLAKEVKVGDSATSTFNMALAGEVLNDSAIEPQIRTTIIQTNITKSLKQSEYVASKFVLVDGFQSLDQNDVEDFKKITPTSKIYYQFVIELTAGKKFKLPSADAAEKFVGISGDKEGVKIERGDDDFFYATSEADRFLTYFLEARNPKSDIESYQKLPSNNPIKKIIDEYRDEAQGFKELAEEEKKNVDYKEAEHAESMQKMFAERSGVCRHRVASVEYKLRTTEGVNQEDFRVVDINRNHVVLEVRNEGKWFKVDLGGGAAICNDLADEKKYSAAAVVETKVEKEKSLEELATTNRDSNHDQVPTPQTTPSSQSKQSMTTVVVKESEYLAAAALTKLKAVQQVAIKIMAENLLAVTKLEEVRDEEDLKTKIAVGDKNKILIVTNKIEDHANFLLHEASNQKRKVFCINDPRSIDLNQTNLLIANDNKPTLTQDGLLSNFLHSASQASGDLNPLLVINWSAFTPKQKLALNSMLDNDRRINGEKIDDSIQIIGLSNEVSKDPSFLSRHNLNIESKIDLQAPKVANSENKTLVDLQGFPNWRRHLFGKVVLVGDQMIWHKSQFAEDLESGKVNFEIANLSSQAARELRREFKQAQAVGKFIYYGREIPCPRNLQISCNSSSFDFTKFSDDTLAKVESGATFNNSIKQNFTLINTNLFDLLLCDKKIDEGHYFEEQGLIEKTATDGTLGLFISSDLSEDQWYCMLNQAQKKRIKLELHLAPEVNLPKQIESWPILASVTLSEDSIHPKQIYVTNNPEKTLETIPDASKAFAVIDVEDFSYQDLIERIGYETGESCFKNFSKTESGFLQALRSGQKIILKGHFAPELLQMIEPILTSKEPEFKGVGENLTLIIEDKDCRQGQVYKPLKWLPLTSYETQNHSQASVATDRPFIESPDSPCELTNSFENSQNFIETRKQYLLEALKNGSMLRLVGHSGVGKSSLIREFETQDSATVTICRELGEFKKWASVKEEDKDKLKILFIDESNIEDRHFTMFSPLKNGGHQRIFYQGEFHDLTENHKVVFACNPKEYGGGRFTQKLFDDGKIPAFSLQDFPSSYIYEKILKEAIYEGLNHKIKKLISEDRFKEICQPLIEEYKAINSRKKSDDDANEETVRELQERTLASLNLNLDELNSATPPKVQSNNFTSTNATKEVEKTLINSLKIRQKQRDKLFSSQAIGLNGVLLEGDSGTGKSELIGAVFSTLGISEKKIFVDSAIDVEDVVIDSDKQKFYKIDANLPLKQKREIIVKAFEEGNIVWIDEINSCIDDGLEKVLNAALTGDHPDGKKDGITPGFMLVSSVNSAGLEGRSIISPALRHRTIAPKVKSLKEYSQDDLTDIVKHWITRKDSGFEVDQEGVDNIAQNIATHFKTCLSGKGGENLNLRMLKENLEEILPAYIDLAKLDGSKLNDSRLPPQSIESVSTKSVTTSEISTSSEQTDQANMEKLIKKSIEDNKASESIIFQSDYLNNSSPNFASFREKQTEITLILPFVATFDSGENSEMGGAQCNYSSSLYIQKRKNGGYKVACIDPTGRDNLNDIPQSIKTALETEFGIKEGAIISTKNKISVNSSKIDTADGSNIYSFDNSSIFLERVLSDLVYGVVRLSDKSEGILGYCDEHNHWEIIPDYESEASRSFGQKLRAVQLKSIANDISKDRQEDHSEKAIDDVPSNSPTETTTTSEARQAERPSAEQTDQANMEKLIKKSIEDNKASESIIFQSDYLNNSSPNFASFREKQTEITLILPFVATFDSGENSEMGGAQCNYSSSLYIQKRKNGGYKVACIDPTGRDNLSDIPQYIKTALEKELGIEEDQIISTKNKISVSSSKTVTADDSNLYSFDNSGIFLERVLSDLIYGIVRLSDKSEGVLEYCDEDNHWEIIPDYESEASRSFGQKLREVQLESIANDTSNDHRKDRLEEDSNSPSANPSGTTAIQLKESLALGR